MGRFDRMTKRSMSRLRSLRPTRFTGIRSAGENDAREVSAVRVIPDRSSEITDKDLVNAAQESVLDVTLGLILNEIANQARFITSATGSAVLLIWDEVPVCRASSGANARDASEYFSECSAIADFSWQEGSPRLCDDVETDHRFDLARCRGLGIRSFMIVPIRDDDKGVTAIVQAFSPRPQAFHDRDLLALQNLGRRIVDHRKRVEPIVGCNTEIDEKIDQNALPEIMEGETPNSRPGWKPAVLRERLNLFLGVLTILIAILLGWTLGRSERESARRNREHSPAPVVNSRQPAVTPAPADTSDVVQVTNRSTESPNSLSSAPLSGAPEVIAGHEPSHPEVESHRNRIATKRSAVEKSPPSAALSSDLVVFENGKQVFPIRAPQSERRSDDVANSGQEQSEPESADHTSSVSVSESVAEEHLLERIEPDYPEYAREQHLQGTVVLNIQVGKDGMVRGLSRVSGDSQLALLAAKAVRQWKFTPLVRDGSPVKFESQITLNFALP